MTDTVTFLIIILTLTTIFSVGLSLFVLGYALGSKSAESDIKKMIEEM